MARIILFVKHIDSADYISSVSVLVLLYVLPDYGTVFLSFEKSMCASFTL